MATVKSALQDALDDLRGTDLKRFRSHLLDRGDIKRRELEKADTDDIAELMVDKYSRDNAGTVALDILRNQMMNHEAANRLEKALTEAGCKF